MSNKIDSMQYAGKINLSSIELGFNHAKPGVMLAEIDKVMEKYIRDAGCVPAFKNYQPEGYPLQFPASVCISPNEVVVHGIPGDYILQIGDLLTIDVGTEYKGWYVDAARSRVIKNPLVGMSIENARRIDKAQMLIEHTEAILEAQLSVVKDQCTFLSMIEAGQKVADQHGVAISPVWGGHGIGAAIHEDPFVPHALDKTNKIRYNIQKKQCKRMVFEAGQTYCIEPVVFLGNTETYIGADNWTVYSKDGGLSAHTERCILVLENGVEILT